MSSDNQFTLAQMQSWMQSALVRQKGRINQIKTELLVNESSRLSAARHLQIYRQSYVARLRECMKNQFSALAYALGEELFQMFADQYLDAYPSASYTLNDLGAKFPLFLEENRPDAAQDEKESWIDFMIELARFEFALSIIFDETAVGIFKPADEISPDENLKLVPTFHIFYHRYPVCRYYLDVTKNKEPELPFEQNSYCAVTRNDFRLRLTELNPAQYYFLERLVNGDSIEEAKKHFIDVYGFDSEKLDNLWKRWRKNFIDAGYLLDKDR